MLVVPVKILLDANPDFVAIKLVIVIEKLWSLFIEFAISESVSNIAGDELIKFDIYVWT